MIEYIQEVIMKQIQRLNDIIAFNQHNPDILAFIGLGSMDETYRLDAYSDVDFFIIVNPSLKPILYNDVSWLNVSSIACWFQETMDGLKVVYEDGILLEFAIFTLDQLPHIEESGGRIYFLKEGISVEDVMVRKPNTMTFNFEKTLNMLYAHCYIGMMRERRDEHVAAHTMIQVYAAHELCELCNPTVDDRFVVERRIEQRLELDFSRLYPGIQHNQACVQFILETCKKHGWIHASMIRLIESLYTD